MSSTICPESKVLFFSPNFNRTGSEVVLHGLIQHADRSKLKMGVACGGNGALMQQLPPDIPTFNYAANEIKSARDESGFRRFRRSALTSIVHRTHQLLYQRPLSTDQFTTIEDNIKQIHESFQPDVWYINTIVQPRVLRAACVMGIPCILHTHELEEMLTFLTVADADTLINYPKLVIASSESSASVIRGLGRDQDIEVVYASMEIDRIKSNPERARAIRKELNIGDDVFVWVMAGALDVNKNPVVFAKIAEEILKTGQRAHFLWLGGAGIESGYSVFARKMPERLNIAKNLSWIIPHEGNYYDYLSVANGLVLTSRQESLSLVAVEVAALGKPIVSFNSGGPRELLKDGMGVIVESWNVSDIVRAMLQVMRGEIDLNAKVSRERAEQFDVSLQVRRWESLIQKYLVGTNS
jgi:glycosyltransferase involved in cell wall biosynthesis